MLPESIKREIKAGKCFYHVNDPYRIHISRVDSDAVVISSCPFLSEQKSEIIPTGFDCIETELYRGLNVTLERYENLIKMNRGNFSLSFDLDGMECVHRFKNYMGDEYEEVLKSKAGIVFPTLNGFAIENDGSVKLKFTSEKQLALYDIGEYCLLYDEREGLIFSINCMADNLTERVNVIAESNGFEHCIEVNAKSKDKVIVTVNGYAPKSLFDTVLDPLKPEFNHAYAENVHLWNEEEGGEWLAIRPNCIVFSDLYSKKLRSARLYMRNLSHKHTNVFYGLLRYYWCAFTIMWATREQPEEWKNAYEERDGYYVLDITEYVKAMFLERVKMSPGLVISARGSDGLVLSTGDNYFAPLLIEMEFEKE